MGKYIFGIDLGGTSCKMGLCMPCPVNPDGVATSSVNLGWENYDVQGLMHTKTGLTVKVGNDVNVACLGERCRGSASG